MISKSRAKQLRALAQKKNRDEQGIFIAEGVKIVGELLPVLPCEYIAATEEWLSQAGRLPDIAIDTLTSTELAQISLLKAPQHVLAVFRKPLPVAFSAVKPQTELCLALDNVQDPGNVGTILRIADWFGIRTVFCSPQCADIFGPKTVQATMGAIARVSVCYEDLPMLIDELPPETPVYGTLLEGESMYRQPLSPNGLLVMGNEGKGLSPSVRMRLNRQLYIPAFPPDVVSSESLNVAVATAIICAEFRRRAVML